MAVEEIPVLLAEHLEVEVDQEKTNVVTTNVVIGKRRIPRIWSTFYAVQICYASAQIHVFVSFEFGVWVRFRKQQLCLVTTFRLYFRKKGARQAQKCARQLQNPRRACRAEIAQIASHVARCCSS